MKLTKHNGRAGKHGVYNPKHNDRSFDVSHSEHIDGERAERNVYWDCYNGYRRLAEKNSDEIEMASTFEEVEQLYYRIIQSGRTPGTKRTDTQNGTAQQTKSLKIKRPAQRKVYCKLGK